MGTENKETPPSSPPDGNSDALFVAVTNLNAHMTRRASTAHGAAPVLGAQRLALDVHARCATSRVPSYPESEAGESWQCWWGSSELLFLIKT